MHLKNRKTGAIFPDHPLLRKHSDMMLCDAEGRSGFDEVFVNTQGSQGASPEQTSTVQDQAPVESGSSTGSIMISRATKAELLGFAKDNFGAELNPENTVEQLRQEVRELANKG